MFEQLITHRLFIEGMLLVSMVLLLMVAHYRMNLSERRRNIRYEIESISFQLDSVGVDVSAETYNPVSNLNKAITQQYRDEDRQFFIFCGLMVVFFILLLTLGERC